MRCSYNTTQVFAAQRSDRVEGKSVEDLIIAITRCLRRGRVRVTVRS